MRATNTKRWMTSGALMALFLLVTAGFSAPAIADDGPSYTGDLIADLGELEKKIVGLAKAIPADKFSWSPNKDVRTVSQALMHTAGANFFFPTLVGGSIPEGVNPRELESITDKDECIAMLEKSYANLRSMVEGVDESKLGDKVNMFGREATMAGLLHSALSHNHEHLGQMIAYARSVGVTPPWSQ